MNGKGKSDIVTKYGVMAFPTSYLLDSRGRIVISNVSFDPKGEKEFKAALRRLGVRPR